MLGRPGLHGRVLVGGVQGREQGGGAVPDVVVGLPLGDPGLVKVGAVAMDGIFSRPRGDNHPEDGQTEIMITDCDGELRG
jgi:hypothetical protein